MQSGNFLLSSMSTGVGGLHAVSKLTATQRFLRLVLFGRTRDSLAFYFVPHLSTLQSNHEEYPVMK